VHPSWRPSARSAVDTTPSPGGHDVSHQAPVARRGLAHQHQRFPHAGRLEEGGLDLRRLEAEAADLDLLVHAPQELDLSPGKPAHAVAGAVKTERFPFAPPTPAQRFTARLPWQLQPLPLRGRAR
jgi:hypothetical protein